MKTMQQTKDCVAVIEDDAVVRRAVCLMFEGVGVEVRAYASAREYLDDALGMRLCACLVLDVRLPGISGIELQRQLLLQGLAPAIVFITGHADVTMAVDAMRSGAVDFLQKPFKEQHLLESVQKALGKARSLRAKQKLSETTVARLACLTPREREVLAGLQRGLRTKAIAAELGISTKTAEEHRANLMRKMHAKNIAELITLCNANP